jgi:hypothetical protein
MKRPGMLRTGRWLAILLLTAATAVAAASALLFAAPAHAAGDTLALTLTNGANFTYGGTAPNFTAVVTFETKPTANYGWLVYVTIEGGETFGSVNQPSKSADGMTLTFAGLRPNNLVAVGQRNATARFLNPGTGVTVYSAPVSFTVNRASADFVCTIGAYGSGTTLLGVGKPIDIHMTPYSGSGQLPAEWLTGTYTIKLDGPTHVAYANASANSDFVVTVTAPTQIGMYTLTCAFNGSASYAPVTMTYPHPYTFSALHALGTVQLFSNPTTLAAGQKMDFYVVFHPASGLPMPTGQFSLWFGNNYTNAFTLGSSGAFLIHLSPLSSLADAQDIQVFYMGDVHYNQATVHFPLTNQPIPSGASGDSASGSSGGNKAQGTPTTAADGTPTTTETPGDGTTPTAVGAGGVVTSTPTDSGGNTGLILIIVALLLLGGAGTAAGIVIYRMRRASAPSNASNDGSQASYDDLAARYGGYWQAGQYDEYGRHPPTPQYPEYPQMGQFGGSVGGAYGSPGHFGESGYGPSSRRRASYDDETYQSPDDW